VYAPVVTPFLENLEPNTAELIRQCEWLLTQDVGLAIFGTNSEANSLSVREKIDLMNTLVEAGIATERMLPGTGCCALSDTVELTRHAVGLGVAGVLMLPPFFYKGVSDEGVFASYAETIERVGDAGLRIYLYHIPQVSQVAISFPVIDRLLKAYPTIVAGIKDSSGNLDNMLEMCRRFPGFGVFAGSEQFLLPVLRAGGAGCISATANVTIAACVDVYRNAEAADVDSRQQALTRQRLAIQSKVLIPALKRIMGRATGSDAWNAVRPPNVPLSQADAAELFAALDETGFALAA